MKKKCKQRLDVEFLSKVNEIGFDVSAIRDERLNICIKTDKDVFFAHSFEGFVFLVRRLNKDGIKFKVSFTYMKTIDLFNSLIFG